MNYIKNFYKKQKIMHKVIYSLLPLVFISFYFFGIRSLLLLLSVIISASFVEWIFVRKTTKKITEALIVSSILFTLTLPPSTPYFIAILGIIFGILFGKMVFGGFGKNPFNPALVGRAFIYVNFPNQMTINWSEPFTNFPAGLTKYSVDTITSSTPLLLYRQSGEMVSYKNLILGNISGSLGETSALLILIAGIYLIYTKTASKHTIYSVLFSFFIFNSIFYYMGFSQIPNPVYGILAGGILFGAIFMATDPISSPKTKEGQVIYGILIGFITIVIRGFALFAGGMMFAILIGNTFAPIIDELVNYIKKRNKERSSLNG